jgi:quercetin dioxygenase-like cupin family protein
MKMKYAAMLLSICVSGAIAQVTPASVLPTGFVHTDEIAWAGAGAFGPGTSSRAVFTKDVFLDDLIRGMWVVKVDPGGQFTVTTSPKEDLAFFVSKGTGKFTLGDDQIDTKPGDAYGVPAGTRYGLANNGSEPVELLMYAAPLIAPNPANKPAKGSADSMEWVPNNTHGPGCDQKMLLRGGFSSVIRNMWLMRGNPGSVNMVHSGGDHQIMYLWVAPVPSATPRDSRTYGARVILRDHVMQARQGDAFYAGGAPRRDEHGLFDESPKDPLIYIAIGALPPGQGPGGPGGPGGRGGRGGRGGEPGGPPQPGR